MTLLAYGPQNPLHHIEIRGRVAGQLTPEGAEAHADKRTRRYNSRQHFYGDLYPVEQKYKETRAIVKATLHGTVESNGCAYAHSTFPLHHVWMEFNQHFVS